METTSIRILDGGMGQELVRRSGLKPTGLWSTQIMMERPDLVRDIHDAFFAAGSHVATTNTYAIHRDRLHPAGIEDRFDELHHLACEMACRSRDNHGTGLVVGSVGPLGWSYSHDGAPPEDQSAELYGEVCRIQSDYVDVYLIETIASIEQARASLRGALGNGKPVWLALTVDDTDGTRLRSGESLAAALDEIAVNPPQAILLNCSVPEAITMGLESIGNAGVPFGAYANGFTGISPDFQKKGSAVTKLTSRIDLTPSAYADHVDQWIDTGATIVGGCCEVGPDHIKELSRRFG
ncbi:homocysteine S-methyltransferase family protein [Roseibium album]|uniref:homocysteine S-methyltransferase family protein n=1 Tax=Roseibium album TaxID=311410 RepID=UPI003918C875